MKKLIAEFIGTFALVFCGTGAIIINQESGGTIGHAGIAISFGLIVTAMIYSFGNVSGAHLNPAVSIAFTAVGLFERKLLIPYIISQLLGALAASGLLVLLFPANENLGSTIPAGSDMQSLVLEFLLTFFLGLVIFFCSQGVLEIKQLAGIVIGGTVLLEAMFAGPICGASMNPARSIGPAVFSGNFSSLWLYILAPVSGAVAAAFTWKALKSEGSVNL